MKIQMDIGFDQLLKIVKALPKHLLRQLKIEVDKETEATKAKIDLETILLNGPTATEEQLTILMENRKAINQWRTKL